jgi:hypothetical protein
MSTFKSRPYALDRGQASDLPVHWLAPSYPVHSRAELHSIDRSSQSKTRLSYVKNRIIALLTDRWPSGLLPHIQISSCLTRRAEPVLPRKWNSSPPIDELSVDDILFLLSARIPRNELPSSSKMVPTPPPPPPSPQRRWQSAHMLSCLSAYSILDCIYARNCVRIRSAERAQKDLSSFFCLHICTNVKFIFLLWIKFITVLQISFLLHITLPF